MPQTLLILGDESPLEGYLLELLIQNGYVLKTVPATPDGWWGIIHPVPDLILGRSTLPNLPAMLVTVSSHAALKKVPILIITVPGIPPDFEHLWPLVAPDSPITFVPTSALLITIERWLEPSIQRPAQAAPVSVPPLPLHFSHEYNTPLTSILGFAYLLQQGYGEEDQGQVASMLDMLIASGQRLKRTLDNFHLANDLLSGSGWAHPWLSEGDSFVSVALVCQVAKATGLRYDHLVTIQSDLEAALVCLSEEARQKLLAELLDNAFKFSSPHCSIEIKGFSQPPFYCLSVTNQGPGLSADDLANVGLYTQFNRAINQQQGLGIGLFIVRQLVEHRQGQLTILSQPSGPTTVVVKLRLATGWAG